MKVVTVVGNRPQFVKLGVTARALRELGDAAPWTSVVVNTGQHYDTMLSDVFFSELQIEAPNYQLGVGSGQIVDQVGRMLPLLREIFEAERPDGVLVYGDTNSTLAAAVAAAHAGLPLFHVEGGERLYRRVQMPEEINRVVTDHLAHLCLCSSRKAVRYLKREGFHEKRALFVGDPMLDLFLLTSRMLDERGSSASERFGLQGQEFALATIHRAENTDDRETAVAIMQALDDGPLPVLLPAHPRLTARLQGWGWSPRKNLKIVDPLGYFEFQGLLRESTIVVSDSGGVNREAYFAGKPCIVPLDNFAWIEAAEAGFSVAVGQDAVRIGELLRDLRPTGDPRALVTHEFGDGHAGERIVHEVAQYLECGSVQGDGAWHSMGGFPQIPQSTNRSQYRFEVLRDSLARLNEGGAVWAATMDAVEGADPSSILIETRVDDDLEAAVRLASLQAGEGVRGIFVVSAATSGYNLLSADAGASLQAVAKAGHSIVIDVQAAAYPLIAELLWVHHKVRAIASHQQLEAATKQWLRTGIDAPKSGGPRLIKLAVEDWSDVPTTPFENGLRSMDRLRDERLKELKSFLIPA